MVSSGLSVSSSAVAANELSTQEVEANVEEINKYLKDLEGSKVLKEYVELGGEDIVLFKDEIKGSE